LLLGLELTEPADHADIDAPSTPSPSGVESNERLWLKKRWSVRRVPIG
jgi:hypothetical protein